MESDSNPMDAASRAESAVAMLSSLPCAADTALPGIGGTIKATPEHFLVEEVLPYAACGEGGACIRHLPANRLEHRRRRPAPCRNNWA